MYSAIILTCVLLISAINSRFFNYDPVLSLFITISLTIIVVILDGLFALFIRRLPNKYFDHNNRLYDSTQKERKFYEKIGIKFWKDHVIELGGFTNFHKDKVREMDNPQYLERFILECNYGSVIHIVTAFTGFLIIFITPLDIWYRFAFPVAFVNMILNLMPAFILRYNTPRLKLARKMALRKLKK